MCVIFLVNKTRPTEEMVRRAWDHNKDGFGIAWREKDAKGKKEIVWEKGVMNLDRALQLCAETPTPYTAHFRVASVGGVKDLLTHPFLVTSDAELELTGRTKEGVLFHNGHWGDWNNRTLDAAIHSNNRIPLGSEWSDSRAMGWLTWIYGEGFLELLTSQKAVLMTPEKTSVFTGAAWDKINDVWCSNDYFWNGRSRSVGFQNQNAHYRMCSYGQCTKQRQDGKTMCAECEALTKRGTTPGTASSVGQSRAVSQFERASAASTVAVATGGNRGPFETTFTLAEVEGYKKANLISNSLWKKYRKAHGARLSEGNKGVRARKRLKELSADVAERLVAGQKH